MRDNFETIKLERRGDHLLIVTLNRPKAGNSMNTLMGEELRDLWSGLYCDQEDIRCAVLTGAGDRIFCAGADLKERNGMTDACLLYTSPSPRDKRQSRMPSSA